MFPYRKALGLRIAPQENLNHCNVVLRHRPAAVRPKSGEVGGRGWLGVSEGWPGDVLGSIRGFSRGGDAAGEPAQQSRGLAAAAAWFL
jgi:hypothetical protein